MVLLTKDREGFDDKVRALSIFPVNDENKNIEDTFSRRDMRRVQGRRYLRDYIVV